LFSGWQFCKTAILEIRLALPQIRTFQNHTFRTLHTKSAPLLEALISMSIHNNTINEQEPFLTIIHFKSIFEQAIAELALLLKAIAINVAQNNCFIKLKFLRCVPQLYNIGYVGK
jgi:hypothetical protein